MLDEMAVHRYLKQNPSFTDWSEGDECLGLYCKVAF